MNRLPGKQSRRSFDRALICRVREGQVQAVRAVRQRGRIDTTPVSLAETAEADRRRRHLGRKCLKVLLIPKTSYLLWTLEIPKVEPHEVAAMIRLETEAMLPPDTGPTEISYRAVTPTRDGYARYEVHIARRQALFEALEALKGRGVDVDLVLPSAVIWSRVFDACEASDLLVTEVGLDQELEAVARDADGSLDIRSLGTPEDPAAAGGLAHRLAEFVRSRITHRPAEGARLKLRWLATEVQPALLRDDQAVIERLAGTLWRDERTDEASSLLHLAGRVLLEGGAEALSAEGNLLPREIVTELQRASVARRTAVAAGAIVAGLLGLYVATQVLIARYQSLNDDLKAKIDLIVSEGKAVGLRVDQLRAIRAAGATRDTFQRVLEGLYAATPEGVTYSRVQFKDDGTVLLQGQAESLALPFLLPQVLEEQSVFAKVLITDAGQSTKAGGQVTEFHIGCRFEGLERP